MSQRINVMVSDEVNEKLNDLSKRYGMSKSSMCAFVIGQWIDTMEVTSKAFLDTSKDSTSMINTLIQNMKNSSKK